MVEVYSGGNSSGGTLTNGSWLDGRTLEVYFGAVYPTPDPNKITFISTFTITTNQGQLKGNRVYLFDSVKGLGSSMTSIDPAASTGIFAGATGVLYIDDIKSTSGAPPNTYYSLVGGQVCFAR